MKKKINQNNRLINFSDTEDDGLISELISIKKGQIVRISHLLGGKSVVGRLHDFGLYKGRTVRLIKKAPFGGPLLIEDIDGQTKLIISRELSKQVLVKELRSSELS